MMTGRRIAMSLSMALAATMGMTACSSGGGSTPTKAATPAAAVYQFDNARVTNSDQKVQWATTKTSLHIQLSSELAKAVAKDEPAVKSYDITSRAYSTGSCRMDANVTYTDGGLAAIKKAAAAKLKTDKTDPIRNDLTLAAEIMDETVSPEVALNSLNPTIVTTIPKASKDQEAYITKDYSKLAIIGECSGDDEWGKFATIQIPSKSDGGSVASTALSYVKGTTKGSSASVLQTILRTGGSDGSVDADVSPDGHWVAKS